MLDCLESFSSPNYYYCYFLSLTRLFLWIMLDCSRLWLFINPIPLLSFIDYILLPLTLFKFMLPYWSEFYYYPNGAGWLLLLRFCVFSWFMIEFLLYGLTELYLFIWGKESLPTKLCYCWLLLSTLLYSLLSFCCIIIFDPFGVYPPNCNSLAFLLCNTLSLLLSITLPYGISTILPFLLYKTPLWLLWT